MFSKGTTCVHNKLSSNVSRSHYELYLQQFIEKTESLRPTINEVNERSHDLEKDAVGKSRQFIEGLLAEVNERWKNLVSKTEAKQMALQVGGIVRSCINKLF